MSRMSVPYVIEGSGTKERVYDLYSRLLRDRIIFMGDALDEGLANSIVAQLLFLEADDSEKDITVYINSPGGLVSGLMAIYDTMNYVKPAVSTVCVGQAASAAAFLLAAGTKGKRYALRNSRIMIHMVSGSAQGHVEDMKRNINEADFLNERLLDELSMITGQSKDKLVKDMNRDFFMSAEESKKYGLIDEVLTSRG